MARTIKAFQFWVKPTEGATKPVRDALAAKGAKPAGFEFVQHAKHFLAQDLAWNNSKGILTGTVYLIRSSNLPAAIENGQAGPLPIKPNTDLGEPMCFAYHPEVGGAVVHYSHTGPRHSVLSEIARRLSLDQAFTVEPLIRTDMLQRLQEKKFFRGIEFALTDPKGIQDLRTAGGSVGDAIGMLDGLHGVSIRVEITMGHTQGEGLAANATKSLARKLAKIGTENVDEHGGVRTIKVRGSEGEDAPVEELDLLKAREEILLEVAESHRSIDTSDACRMLTASLSDRLKNFKAQAGNA